MVSMNLGVRLDERTRTCRGALHVRVFLSASTSASLHFMTYVCRHKPEEEEETSFIKYVFDHIVK